jgi:ubiquinone/menaquinone biosynthesis C-methylase UbiE
MQRLGSAERHDIRHTVSLIAPHLQSGDSILDVGCGAAHVTAALAERGHEVWGVDIVDSRKSGHTNFKLYDGLSIDFPDRCFDVVVLAFVLHHVPNELKSKLVEETRRLCRRTLVVIEDTPRNRIDRFFSNRHGEKFRKSIGSTADFGFYSQSEWETFFQREAFQVAQSQRLSRFCRDWKQPYARSCFVLHPRQAT